MADVRTQRTWLSAKVRPKDRVGVDGWIRFHAAYSRSFAEDALRGIAQPGSTVLDPFCGSGTTMRAAARLGAKGVAVDMNPALVALARSTLATPEQAQKAIEALAIPSTHGDLAPSGLADAWLNPETRRGLVAARQVLSNKEVGDFGLGLLVASARSIVKPAEGSNPTWPKPPRYRKARNVQKILTEKAALFKADLERFNEGRLSSECAISVGDAKNLILPDESVDAILTSPPYLSRIDYVKATLPELIALGYDEQDRIDELRTAVMGGVLTERKVSAEDPKWGTSAGKLLKAMASHESKASKTYYKFLAEQYLSDLDQAVSEMMRVLKRGGTALVVVQTSYYKDVLIPLPKIVAELGRLHGASSYVGKPNDVTQHFGHLSPHQRKYVKGKTLREAVVSLTK